MSIQVSTFYEVRCDGCSYVLAEGHDLTAVMAEALERCTVVYDPRWNRYIMECGGCTATRKRQASPLPAPTAQEQRA